MYFSGVNPVKAFLNEPAFARYFFVDSAIRLLYAKITGEKLRLSRYADLKVHEINYANEVLKEKIRNNTAFMASRYGTAELSSVTDVLLKRYGLKKELNMEGIKTACNHNGIFPISEEVIMKFADITLESSKELDLLGTFRMIMEDYYIKYYAPKSVVLTQRYVFDFWLHNEPFTTALQGKKVLVIHPFEKTIKMQYEYREKLFDNKKILPLFELKTLKAVQSIAGEPCEFNTWFDALNYMYTEAMKIDFDVALLGCGAYGFPLAAMLKKEGKCAIHMGGVTQILFGIKGKRWDNDPIASKLYNEYWVRPDQSEIPARSRVVEDGCYW